MGQVPKTRFDVAGKMVVKYRKKIAAGRVRGAWMQLNRVDMDKILVDLATEVLEFDKLLDEPWGRRCGLGHGVAWDSE